MVGEEVKEKLTFTGKDVEKIRILGEKLEAALKEAIEGASREAARQNDLAPLVDVLKSVKISRKDTTITMEGQGKAEAIKPLFKSLLLAGPNARGIDK